MKHLPAHLQPLATFLYWTGWRKNEALMLEWRQVDLKAGVIRIEKTENNEPRSARNMIRAGIPQPVAMKIGGWKTDSIFRRYAIVDERLLAENIKKVGELARDSTIR